MGCSALNVRKDDPEIIEGMTSPFVSALLPSLEQIEVGKTVVFPKWHNMSGTMLFFLSNTELPVATDASCMPSKTLRMAERMGLPIGDMRRFTYIQTCGYFYQ